MRTGDHSLARVLSLGVRAASPIDLIAVGYARWESDSGPGEEVARKLLSRYGSLSNLAEAAPAEIGTLTGLDEFEVVRVQALLEIGRRVAVLGKGEKDAVDSPQDAVKLIVRELRKYDGEKREHVFVVLLDSKNNVLKIETVHIGTLTASLVGPREVFRVAIRDGASSLILAHNHPSGDPTPSPEDIELTRRMVEIGKMLDIPVLDHVIVGDPDFRSLHRLGFL